MKINIERELFSQVNKIRIRTERDLSSHCHICNEGKSAGRKFRLHLFNEKGWEGNVVKCFNCGYSQSFYTYLKEYHPELLNIYTSRTKSMSLDKFKTQTTDDFGFEFEETSKPKIEHEHPHFLDIKQLQVPQDIKEYLNNRKISHDDFFYVKDTKVMSGSDDDATPVSIKNALCIPLKDFDGKFIGFQAISDILGKKTYKILSTGSKIWGLHQIKPGPVLVCESVFDAMSTGLNSIASLGVKINIDYLEEILDNTIVIAPDNQNVDKASFDFTKKHIQFTKFVLWPSDIVQKDWNELLITTNQNKVKQVIKENITSGLSAFLGMKR